LKNGFIYFLKKIFDKKSLCYGEIYRSEKSAGKSSRDSELSVES